MDNDPQSTVGVSSPWDSDVTATTAAQPTLAQKLNIAMRGESVADNAIDDAAKLATLVVSRVPELRVYAIGASRHQGVTYCKSLAVTLLMMAFAVADAEASSFDASHEFHGGLAIPQV